MIGWVPVDRVEPVAVAVRKLLLHGDVHDLTLRRIAEHVGCTASTLSHRFGSREAMIAHAAQWLGDQWCRAVAGESVEMRAILSTYEHTGEQLRAWLTMCEIGRGNAVTAGVVARAKREERRLLERVLPSDADRATRDLWVGLVRGLHHELHAGDDPLPLERARAAVARFAALVEPDTTDLDRAS